MNSNEFTEKALQSVEAAIQLAKDHSNAQRMSHIGDYHDY
jgi:hypothetical protein